jgi:hypothetical protein
MGTRRGFAGKNLADTHEAERAEAIESLRHCLTSTSTFASILVSMMFSVMIQNPDTAKPPYGNGIEVRRCFYHHRDVHPSMCSFQTGTSEQSGHCLCRQC